ncbi:MAG: hypothetical protein CMF17_11770 [Idiomarinaceae bacterium]|nr:hypothetical protein [Idiomarinaceae bacterium]
MVAKKRTAKKVGRTKQVPSKAKRPRMPDDLMNVREQEVLSALHDASGFLSNAAKAAAKLKDTERLAGRLQKMFEQSARVREQALKQFVRGRSSDERAAARIQRKKDRAAKIRAQLEKLEADLDQ